MAHLSKLLNTPPVSRHHEILLQTFPTFPAELGDFDEDEHGTTYLSGIKLLPRQVRFHFRLFTSMQRSQRSEKTWKSSERLENRFISDREFPFRKL